MKEGLTLIFYKIVNGKQYYARQEISLKALDVVLNKKEMIGTTGEVVIRQVEDKIKEVE
jgi:hypothetical protein